MSRKSGGRECGGLEDIAGRWKVTEVPPEARAELLPIEGEEDESSKELRGLVVVLEAQGEVTWEVPVGAPEGVLLFETNSAHLRKDSLTFLGGVQGWSLTFKVKGEPEDGWMVLESDTGDEGACFSLSLAKEENSGVEVMDDHFCLKKALDETFFSDVVFACSDREGLQAHRAVLAAAYPDMQEADWMALFRTQPADLGRQLLYCMYSDCLPQDLTVARAKQMVAWVAAQPRLGRLSQLMSAFIEANNLKQRLISLIEELQALLQDAKRMVSMVDMADAMKVKYTIKQLSEDAAVGAAKFSLLCQLYTRNRKEMGKADSREVLEYLRVRVVVFMDLIRELALETVQKWESLSQEEQLDVATALIPDVEEAWDLFLKYATDLQASINHPVEGKPAKSGAPQRRTGVSMVLHLIFRGSERKRLRKIRKEFLESVEMAQGKRERWQRYSSEEKAGQVLNVVGKLVNEAEDLQETMETRKRQLLLANGLEWRTFRSYVDIACMYMTWGLQKVLALKDPLKPLLYRGLKFVGSSEVNEAVVYLGLLGGEELEVWLEEIGGDTGANSSSEKLPQSLSKLQPGMELPSVADSVLAQGCARLASSQQYADMDFVLESSQEGEGKPPTVIPAHRVIVASRCEWACRALQSGMREALERRIVVTGVDEEVFRLFLRYLYGGSLETSTMTTEALVDLMAVADRFESCVLLRSCETLLVDRIEDTSVFQLLAVAEIYQSERLRASSLQYILSQPEVIMQEVEGYSSLSETLRQELRDLLSGTQDPTLALRHSRPAPAHATATSIPAQPQAQGTECSGSGASSEDEEEFQLESDTLEWEAALENLRAVVGSEADDDVLRYLLLAADMDINRAVNFFFNAQ